MVWTAIAFLLPQLSIRQGAGSIYPQFLPFTKKKNKLYFEQTKQITLNSFAQLLFPRKEQDQFQGNEVHQNSIDIVNYKL